MAILSCHVSIKLPPKISDGQEFSIRRVWCRQCGGVKREGLEWLADNPLYTKRFAYYVGRRHYGAGRDETCISFNYRQTRQRTVEIQSHRTCREGAIDSGISYRINCATQTSDLKFNEVRPRGALVTAETPNSAVVAMVSSQQ